MQKRKKRLKSAAILFGIILIVCLLFKIADFVFRLDFSQDYRKVEGIENIVFERNGWGSCYKRCFWGLARTEDSYVNNPDNRHESDSSEDEIYKLINTWVRQSIYSPDKKYILYCEIEYLSSESDDENCYYRVYEMESGNIITIYQGYREWYNLFWLNNDTENIL